MQPLHPRDLCPLLHTQGLLEVREGWEGANPGWGEGCGMGTPRSLIGSVSPEPLVCTNRCWGCWCAAVELQGLPLGAGILEGCTAPHSLRQNLAVCSRQPLCSRRWGGRRAGTRGLSHSSRKNRALGRGEALGRRGRRGKQAADRINDGHMAALSVQGCPGGRPSWWSWPPLGSWGDGTGQPLGAGTAPRSAWKRQKDQWHRWGWILTQQQLPRHRVQEAATPTHIF